MGGIIIISSSDITMLRFVTVELICDLTKTDPELRAFDDESFHYVSDNYPRINY